jgi:hypothetical protein
MELFDSAISDLSSRPPDTSVVSANDSEQLKRPPLLLRIFQAYILGQKLDFPNLAWIHVLLDISWVDLRLAICSLRPIVGTDEAKIRALIRLVGEHHFPELSIATLSSDLARGCIRFIKDVVRGRQPRLLLWFERFPQIFGSLIFFIRQRGKLWGRFVRSSPHSTALLQDIGEFPSFDSIHQIGPDPYHPEDYHNVLQWLKVCSNAEAKHEIIHTLAEPGISRPSARYTCDRHLAALSHGCMPFLSMGSDR